MPASPKLEKAATHAEQIMADAPWLSRAMAELVASNATKVYTCAACGKEHDGNVTTWVAGHGNACSGKCVCKLVS